MPQIILIVVTFLSGLTFPLLIPATACAVSISLVPDRSTTIGIGETINVDVFMVLDASDQVTGVSAATLHLEQGRDFVSVVGSGAGSVFTTAAVGVVAPPGPDFIVFSQFGTTVTSAEAKLGTLA